MGRVVFVVFALVCGLLFVCAEGSISEESTIDYHRRYVRETVRRLSGRDVNTHDSDDGDETIIDGDNPLHVDHAMGQYIHPRHHFFVYWLYQEDAAHFFIAAPYPSWIAIGFSHDRYMPASDIIVGSLNKVVVDDVYEPTFRAVISDRYTPANSREMPAVDTQQDVELIRGEYENRWTMLEFRRAVDTKDADHDLRLDQVSHLLWAVGFAEDEVKDGGFGEFKIHERRGLVSVHFPTGKAIHIEDLSREEAHASLMLYAWGLFAVISIFCSRYMKDPLGSWWFVVHATLAIMIFLLTISGFSVIISYVSMQKNHHHFHTLHQIVGLTVTLLMIAQLILGVIARMKYDPERENVPLFPDKVHWWVGRLTTTAAFFNIFSGFVMFAQTGKAPWILLFTWVVAILVFTAIFEIYSRGDIPSRSTVAKEYQLLEFGIQVVHQNNSALLFCFGALVFLGLVVITLAVSLLER